ncbi:MAG: serpin family protein [Oscillospiraceae bacterium]|nr:serpin family protein [Oscillospiraceae bacterium]
MKRIKSSIAMFLAAAITLTALTACSESGTSEILAEHTKITAAPLDESTTELFSLTATDFTAEVFRRAYAESNGDNTLISPLSILLALAMTANGANGETLTEMEAVLGKVVPIDVLTALLASYTANLPSSNNAKLKLANSIWFRDDEERLTVEESFLTINRHYYGAQIAKSPFDKTTLNEINGWVKDNTDGMIEHILDEIPPEAIMYLINTVMFDAQWREQYKESQVCERTFTALDGSKQKTELMYSDETRYLETDNATGFMKPYKSGYSFAALLPNEDVAFGDFVAGLTGENLRKSLEPQDEYVKSALPKFSFDYDIEMSDVLTDMGMPTAFDDGNADFARLGKSTHGNIHIGRVLHKAFIEVAEDGTRAGAATVVALDDGGEAYYEEYKTVILDRPFVFAIVDNATNTPIFMGALTNV